MQRVTGLLLEPAAIHPMIVLEVADDGLDCLSAPEPAPLRVGQGLEAAAVDDLDARDGRLHAPEPQVHHRLLRTRAGVLGQDLHLLELLGERMAVVGVAREVTLGVQAASRCTTVSGSDRAGLTLRIVRVLKYGGKIIVRPL